MTHYNNIIIINRAEKEWDEKLQILQKKHEEEIASFQSTNNINNDDDTNDTHDTNIKTETTDSDQPQTQELSAKEKALAKRLRKKQNAKLKEKQREEEIANEIANAPNYRQIEIDTMKELYLNKEQLKIEEVAADGNCLYRAIARQMEFLEDSTSSADGDNSYDYLTMRNVCADQLIKSRDDYEPFADLEDINVSSYEEYVDKVRASSEWGGHLELRALSHALKKTIVVYSADVAPLHIQHDDNCDSERVIRLSFHRRYYALGEHYNSVVPVVMNDE